MISQYLAAAAKKEQDQDDKAQQDEASGLTSKSADSGFSSNEALDSIKVNENDLKSIGATSFDELNSQMPKYEEDLLRKSDNTDMSSTINKQIQMINNMD